MSWTLSHSAAWWFSLLLTECARNPAKQNQIQEPRYSGTDGVVHAENHSVLHLATDSQRQAKTAAVSQHRYSLQHSMCTVR